MKLFVKVSILLSGIVVIVLLFLFARAQSKPSADVCTALEDAAISSSGKNRPTPDQLEKEYLIWDLRDLEKQATAPEDKALIHRAIEVKQCRWKALELSSDFEKSRKKAIK